MGRNKNKEISTALYKKLAPLLPVVTPSVKGGRPRLSDEQALNGIVFVLRTGMPWEDLPQELGFGSGMTCWRRLRDWQAAGVWHGLHLALLDEPRQADKPDFSRFIMDGASVPSPRGLVHRPQPHAQGQAGQQTPPHHGPPRHPDDVLRYRCQSA